MNERVQGLTADEIRRCVDEEELRDWVQQQRWYASKSRSISGIVPLDDIAVGITKLERQDDNPIRILVKP